MTSTRLLNPFDELIGSKSLSLRPDSLISARNVSGVLRPVNSSMDLGIVAAIAMLIIWAFATITTEASGYVHALLTLGVFLLIWRVVVIGTSRAKTPPVKR